MKKEATELVVLSPDTFMALRDPSDEVQELIADFFADGLREDDLHTIKIPTGGGQNWDLPGEQSARTFIGIIIGEQLTRAYWPEAFSGSGVPAACSSRDGIMGVGTPGGECALCELAMWGSGRTGTGTACTQRKIVYVLMPGDMLPVRLALPATSFGNLRKYRRDVFNKLVRSSAAVCEFGLMKTVSKNGITYSQATFKIVDLLEPYAAAQAKAYAAVLARSLSSLKDVEQEEAKPKPRYDLNEDDLPDSWTSNDPPDQQSTIELVNDKPPF